MSTVPCVDGGRQWAYVSIVERNTRQSVLVGLEMYQTSPSNFYLIVRFGIAVSICPF